MKQTESYTKQAVSLVNEAHLIITKAKYNITNITNRYSNAFVINYADGDVTKLDNQCTNASIYCNFLAFDCRAISINNEIISFCKKYNILDSKVNTTESLAKIATVIITKLDKIQTYYTNNQSQINNFSEIDFRVYIIKQYLSYIKKETNYNICTTILTNIERYLLNNPLILSDIKLTSDE